ncbi:MAG: hypothetical protein QXE01_03555 [Sulfolobales archaeon]
MQRIDRGSGFIGLLAFASSPSIQLSHLLFGAYLPSKSSGAKVGFFPLTPSGWENPLPSI